LYLGLETVRKFYLPHFSARIVLFDFGNYITFACLFNFAFIDIMTIRLVVFVIGMLEKRK